MPYIYVWSLRAVILLAIRRQLSTTRHNVATTTWPLSRTWSWLVFTSSYWIKNEQRCNDKLTGWTSGFPLFAKLLLMWQSCKWISLTPWLRSATPHSWPFSTTFLIRRQQRDGHPSWSYLTAFHPKFHYFSGKANTVNQAYSSKSYRCRVLQIKPHYNVHYWQVEEKKAATEVLLEEMSVQRAGAGEWTLWFPW